MMMDPTRRNALIMLAVLTIPSTLEAAGSKSSTGDPLTVELSSIALPVVRNGMSIDYVFGTIKIELGDAPSTLFLRERSYLLRDAIVRLGARAPIPAGSTPQSFDRVAVTRLVLQAIKAVRPEARVKRVTVEDAAFVRS